MRIPSFVDNITHDIIKPNIKKEVENAFTYAPRLIPKKKYLIFGVLPKILIIGACFVIFFLSSVVILNLYEIMFVQFDFLNIGIAVLDIILVYINLNNLGTVGSLFCYNLRERITFKEKPKRFWIKILINYKLWMFSGYEVDVGYYWISHDEKTNLEAWILDRCPNAKIITKKPTPEFIFKYDIVMEYDEDRPENWVVRKPMTTSFYFPSKEEALLFILTWG